MSNILSASTNVSVLKIQGALPDADSIFAVVSSSLDRLAFKNILEGTTESSVGWVQVNDHNATDFNSPAFLHIDKYLFLSLRKDTRKVPAAVLKQECVDREAAWLQNNPATKLKRPPKRTREEIKEAAKLDLLKKTLPVPKVFDAVINTETQIVYLLTTSTKEVDLFTEMFKRTFGEGLTLSPLTPWSMCSGGVSRLDADKLDELNRATSEAYLDVIKSNEWIGEDFLLWLISGHAEGSVQGVSAWIDDKVILTGFNDSSELQKVSLIGPLTNRMATLKSAIKDGKQIAEATIHMEDNDGNSYKLTMDGRNFWIKGLKCPTAKMTEQDLTDEVSETQAAMLYRVAGISDTIKHLLQKHLMEFLDARLNRWGIVQSNVHDWIEEGA